MYVLKEKTYRIATPKEETAALKSMSDESRRGHDYLKNKFAPGPHTCALLAHDLFEHMNYFDDRERSVILTLDTMEKVTGFHLLGIGNMSAVVSGPREIFRILCLGRNDHFVHVHNHPCGSDAVLPSSCDIQVTKRLYAVGQLMDIPMVDSIILSPVRGRYYSFSTAGRLSEISSLSDEICSMMGSYPQPRKQAP